MRSVMSKLRLMLRGFAKNNGNNGTMLSCICKVVLKYNTFLYIFAMHNFPFKTANQHVLCHRFYHESV